MDFGNAENKLSGKHLFIIHILFSRIISINTTFEMYKANARLGHKQTTLGVMMFRSLFSVTFTSGVFTDVIYVGEQNVKMSTACVNHRTWFRVLDKNTFTKLLTLRRGNRKWWGGSGSVCRGLDFGLTSRSDQTYRVWTDTGEEPVHLLCHCRSAFEQGT